ncbi:hypothetical protein PghCCS26_47150 [Paenibacillus glycanilyticus]|uniref:Uncharacterized protein n=1 Tax=Paenibacillus glycanilyticus TaxID=126569 RepID=A0ABQ6NR57_9BACL|nr:hypothetical protein PghCCS26_47150 [Paenibacillus glycanilyticus]
MINAQIPQGNLRAFSYLWPLKTKKPHKVRFGNAINMARHGGIRTRDAQFRKA